MNLFKHLSEIMPEGIDLNMTLRRKDDLLIVSIIPKSGELEDNAKDRLSPLVVSGTPDELDEGSG